MFRGAGAPAGTAHAPRGRPRRRGSVNDGAAVEIPAPALAAAGSSSPRAGPRAAAARRSTRRRRGRGGARRRRTAAVSRRRRRPEAPSPRGKRDAVPRPERAPVAASDSRRRRTRARTGGRPGRPHARRRRRRRAAAAARGTGIGRSGGRGDRGRNAGGRASRDSHRFPPFFRRSAAPGGCSRHATRARSLRGRKAAAGARLQPGVFVAASAARRTSGHESPHGEGSDGRDASMRASPNAPRAGLPTRRRRIGRAPRPARPPTPPRDTAHHRKTT